MADSVVKGELDEIGIDEDIAAASFRRVFALIYTGREPDADDEIGPGWYAVVSKAGAMFGDAADDDLTLSYAQFGDLLRAAFARAEDSDADIQPFEEIVPLVRHAWVYLARHAANLFNMDDKEVRRLETHEAQIADLAREKFGPIT